MSKLLERLGMSLPIIQAPMAGVSTAALAAAVSNAGALGSISVGAVDAVKAKAMIAETRKATNGSFNVNVFAHTMPIRDPAREDTWLKALTPYFEAYDASPPTQLNAIYNSFNDDDAMLSTLIETAPAVISFHFGLPTPERREALKAAGAILLASATTIEEGRAAQHAGMDAVIAQGYEAGGHRGMFDPAQPDECLKTFDLTRVLVRKLTIPVIAAGGIMNGKGIADALGEGAIATQLGTAFILCDESSADAAYRAALLKSDIQTTLVTAISGRPARCLHNRFTELDSALKDIPRPDYPIAYDAGKALHAAAKAKGESGYGAQWAGKGVAHCRSMSASALIQTLAQELRDAHENLKRFAT